MYSPASNIDDDLYELSVISEPSVEGEGGYRFVKKFQSLTILYSRSRHDSATNKVVFMVVSDDIAWVKVIIHMK